MNVFIVIFLSLLTIAWSVPLEHHRVETNPELTPGYFEGDMVLDVNKRNGLIDPIKKWINKTVYYKINDAFFDAAHRNYIITAMRSIENVSCIRFVDVTQTDKSYYLNITGYPRGCYSSVGWTTWVQYFNLQVYPLGKGCFELGVIVHELLHALGFHHMQSDSDRDNYVRVVQENIKQGEIKNFVKLGANVVDNFDQEYDYASIMHYNAYAYSKNGRKTIIPLNNTPKTSLMGQRYMMTNSDIVKLNMMYKCPIKV